MTGAELLAVAYSALTPDERDEAFALICASRARAQAGDESLTERYLRSLQRAAVCADGHLTAEEYRRVREELAGDGEALEPLSRIIKHFTSWRMASEALMLSEHHVAGEIQRRFRARRVGKVWKYSEPTLRDTLRRCVDYYGRVPQVAEFEWWRQGLIDAAMAAGDDNFHLPSANPYRKRWKTWERALRHFGYTHAQIERRLEVPVAAR